MITNCLRLLLSLSVMMLALCDVSRTATDSVVTITYGQSCIIPCENSLSTSTVSWMKDGQPLDVNVTSKYTANSTSLTIHSPKESDGGVYVCIISINNQTLNHTTVARTPARVGAMDKSTNLVEGDRLSLTCTVYGYPLPDIKWLKDWKELNESRIKLFPNSANVTDGNLVIDHLEYGDRAEYTCVGTNVVNNASATIMVRVKDKLAALWPFLGIVAEVVILCTIILIYEKRRAKQEYDESDTDQNNESKPVADQKDKEVRQRK